VKAKHSLPKIKVFKYFTLLATESSFLASRFIQKFKTYLFLGAKSGLVYDGLWGKTSGSVYIDRFGYFRFLQKAHLANIISSNLKRGARMGFIFSSAVIIITYAPWLKLKADKTFSDKSVVPEVRVEIPDEDKRFTIIIPKLNIKTQITANVDANDREEYMEALKKGVVHARGSGLPDDYEKNKSIYLFAHSSDPFYNIGEHNAIFYSLNDLSYGDEIIIWFWGKKYKFKVTGKEFLQNSDTRYFKPQFEKKLLILQSCWPPGTRNKQLVIIAEPV